jgi:CheY-like chemotaxis protein
MLDQVLMNLSVNARDAMPGGGRLVIETGATVVDDRNARSYPQASPGSYVCVRITDSGHGIPADVLPRIFEPFFTTKGPGKGTGLGLATVFGIVQQHRGWINVASDVGQGTTFEVCLPAAEGPRAGSHGARARAKPRGGHETILIAEDDPAVRSLMSAVLERHGYRVLQAATGEEAVALWRTHGGAVALLLTDLVMPGGTSGQELARQLQGADPRLRVIFTSGYSADMAGRPLDLRSGENFLPKPFEPQRLLEIVRVGLDD